MPYTPKVWAEGDDITANDLNHIEVGIQTVSDDFDDFVAEDSGWLTSGITAQTGWSITTQRYRKVRGMMVFHVEAKRTGSAITVPTNGNITNSPVATFPAGYYSTNFGQGMSSANVGSISIGYLNTAGSLDLVAVAPGTSLATNASITLAGVIMVG